MSDIVSLQLSKLKSLQFIMILIMEPEKFQQMKK